MFRNSIGEILYDYKHKKAYTKKKKLHLNKNFGTQWEKQYSAPSIDNEYYWDVALSESYGNIETFSPPSLSLLTVLAVQDISSPKL